MTTPRERVERALRHEPVDVIPFTVYEALMPQCTAEREMRNRGLCIVKRDVPAFRTHSPNVRTTQQVFYEDGKRMVRTSLKTPGGKLTSLR
jgi:hypothetical protein